MTSSNIIQGAPDLKGKVAVVTGATSGIGLAVTRQLLRKGATVYLAARNESKVNSTILRLEAEGLASGHGKAKFHHLVLDDPASAKKSAEELIAKLDRLDILINNAAIMIKLNEFKKTYMGIQESIVVNHLSPFVFTNTLLPLLKKTASEPGSDVRIVNVASDAHTYVSGVQFKTKEDLNASFDNLWQPSVKRYGFSKLANILWTRELSRRLGESHDDGGSRIMCLCVHPGAVYTEGNLGTIKALPFPLSFLFKLLFKAMAVSPDQGASTLVVAATSQHIHAEMETYQGAYLVPVGKVGVMSKTASDPQLAKDLWALTEAVLSEAGL